MLDEEWKNGFEELLLSPYPIGHPVFVIAANDAATEKGFQAVQELNIAFVLHDGELGQNLKSCCHFRMGVDSHVETTFTVHESHNPSCIKVHLPVPNGKSLRVLQTSERLEPSLRIVPMSRGF